MTSPWKSSRPTTASSQSLAATALVERGSPVSSAISPKKPPCFTASTTFAPSLMRDTSPEITMKNASPVSPFWKMLSPAFFRSTSIPRDNVSNSSLLSGERKSIWRSVATTSATGSRAGGSAVRQSTAWARSSRRATRIAVCPG